MQQKTFDLTTLNGANGFSIPGIMAGGTLGSSVAAAGDINGDGLNDVLLGSYGTNSYAGTCYVIFGSRSGFTSSFNLTILNGANGFIVSGIAASGHLGISVSNAGDINGDGLSDVVLGASWVNSYTGASYVILGSTTQFPANFSLLALNGTNGFSIAGEAPSNFLGVSVSSAGDINADGLSDVALGAANANTYAGISYVIFGSRSSFSSSFSLATLNGTNGFSVPGIIAGGGLGYILGNIPDINGDGLGELVLIAVANTKPGTAYVIFGSRGGFSSPFDIATLNGTNGFSVSAGIVIDYSYDASIWSSGDINGDGLSELILGSSAANSNMGIVYVIFGTRSSFPANFDVSSLNGSYGFSIPGILSSGFLGQSLATNDDINEDGLNDLVLGAFGANGNTGITYVIFGSRSGFPASFNLTSLNGINGFSVPGITPGDYFGFSVASAGDVNGDGFSDLVLGAPYANSSIGVSYLIFGNPFTWNKFNNYLTLLEGQSLLLNHTHFNLTHNVTVAPLIFTVSSVQGARFELVTNPGTPIFNFSQTQIDSHQIQLVSDRTNSVSYQVAASCGRWIILSQPGNVTFINDPPIVLNAPTTQVVSVNTTFSFSLNASQIFNDADNDPLIYSAQLKGGALLPSWLQFSENPKNQLTFNGTALSAGITQISLSATDPLNASVSTEVDILAVPNSGPTVNVYSISSTQIIEAVMGGIVGLAALVGGGLGFWRYAANKSSRKGEQFANLIREQLNLKGIDNFHSTLGKRYVLTVYALQDNLKNVGIDINTMRLGELQDLVRDIGDAAHNKISTATDCLGRSVITVTDLNDNLQNLVNEVQVLRAGTQKHTA